MNEIKTNKKKGNYNNNSIHTHTNTLCWICKYHMRNTTGIIRFVHAKRSFVPTTLTYIRFSFHFFLIWTNKTKRKLSILRFIIILYVLWKRKSSFLFLIFVKNKFHSYLKLKRRNDAAAHTQTHKRRKKSKTERRRKWKEKKIIWKCITCNQTMMENKWNV